MRTYLLQDYTTIIQPSAVTSVIQSEDTWLELVGASDLIMFVQFLDGTGFPTVYLDSAPSVDETLFAEIAESVSSGSYGDVEMSPIPALGNSNPPNRFVRWRIGSGSGNPWKLTFRVYLCVNFVGAGGRVLQNGRQIASLS